MDPEMVAIEALQITVPEHIISPEQLDDTVASLTSQLTRIADATTPRRKASQGRGEQWWDLKVDGAVRGTRRARRHYISQPTDYNWRQL